MSAAPTSVIIPSAVAAQILDHTLEVEAPALGFLIGSTISNVLTLTSVVMIEGITLDSSSEELLNALRVFQQQQLIVVGCYYTKENGEEVDVSFDKLAKAIPNACILAVDYKEDGSYTFDATIMTNPQSKATVTVEERLVTSSVILRHVQQELGVVAPNRKEKFSVSVQQGNHTVEELAIAFDKVLSDAKQLNEKFNDQELTKNIRNAQRDKALLNEAIEDRMKDALLVKYIAMLTQNQLKVIAKNRNMKF